MRGIINSGNLENQGTWAKLGKNKLRPEKLGKLGNNKNLENFGEMQEKSEIYISSSLLSAIQFGLGY
jgi:hypothetical protein